MLLRNDVEKEQKRISNLEKHIYTWVNYTASQDNFIFRAPTEIKQTSNSATKQQFR